MMTISPPHLGQDRFACRASLPSLVPSSAVCAGSGAASDKRPIFSVLSRRMPPLGRFALQIACRAMIGGEASVADAVDSGGQDMDREPADEPVGGQVHDRHAVPAPDAMVFPEEGRAARVGADRAGVGDGDAMGVSARLCRHRLGPAEGGKGDLELILMDQFGPERVEPRGRHARPGRSCAAARDEPRRQLGRSDAPDRGRRRVSPPCTVWSALRGTGAGTASTGPSPAGRPRGAAGNPPGAIR